MTIYFIRHGRTTGNEEGRYAGSTEYLLTPAGEEACRAAHSPQVQRVYSSPMRRCLQTAELLFPEHQPIVVEQLQECDFGEFEDKTHEELKDLPTYQAFLAAPETATPPGGESWQEFADRCCAAFIVVADEAMSQGLSEVAIVAHGGVIMSVLERFGVPKRGIYDWIVENIGGWEITLDVPRWTQTRTVESVVRIETEAKHA